MIIEKRKLICITCPLGCRLEVFGLTDNLQVSGHKCKKGIDYANDEIINPTRMVCTTAKIKGGIHKVIPVKTSKPIAEKYKFDVVKAVNQLQLTSPVKMGDIVIQNIFNTGVDIVAERDM